MGAKGPGAPALGRGCPAKPRRWGEKRPRRGRRGATSVEALKVAPGLASSWVTCCGGSVRTEKEDPFLQGRAFVARALIPAL